ncbi:tetratricopeptide repeat protein [Acinetobacter guillouiae]|uniref:tetratricopeptide repeat protein n=1 Tax=Acinetobacter guillouiae TaxID=106649 RepID=UPI003AF9D023
MLKYINKLCLILFFICMQSTFANINQDLFNEIHQDKEIQYHRGLMFLDENSPNKNTKQGVEWIHKSANQGYPKAQFVLGMLYNEGIGVKQSYSAAAEWYRKAADQGLPDAQLNLAILYHAGRGVPKNLTTAKKWYQKAAKQGSVRAENILDGLK